VVAGTVFRDTLILARAGPPLTVTGC